MDAKFLMVFLMAVVFVCTDASPAKLFNRKDETGKNADPKRLPRIGNELTCPCFDEQGTYWWPYCPPGWELCWSAAPFGECCI